MHVGTLSYNGILTLELVQTLPCDSSGRCNR